MTQSEPHAPTDDDRDLTRLLNRGAGGDEAATHLAFDRVYSRLRAIAGGPRGARADDTMHPTALVHEVYAKLFRGGRGQWENRAHFFNVAAKAMRRIAIDHARAAVAQKRGGGWRRLTGLEDFAKRASDPVELLALDDALTVLAELHPRQAAVVELRYFAGLSVKEVSAVLGVSPRSVDLDWRAARAWLRARLDGEGEGDR